jgi:hypothetical protein
MKNRWDRDMKLYHIFADEQSTLTIPDYTRAKKRRDITSPFFSRKSIVDLQSRIQDCVRARTLCSMCRSLMVAHSWTPCAKTLTSTSARTNRSTCSSQFVVALWTWFFQCVSLES